MMLMVWNSGGIGAYVEKVIHNNGILNLFHGPFTREMKTPPRDLTELGDTPLCVIEKTYGREVAEKVRAHFAEHPSERFRWIQRKAEGRRS